MLAETSDDPEAQAITTVLTWLDATIPGFHWVALAVFLASFFILVYLHYRRSWPETAVANPSDETCLQVRTGFVTRNGVLNLTFGYRMTKRTIARRRKRKLAAEVHRTRVTRKRDQ
jgi:hypothetical protein